MKISKLENMLKGWFVGDFSPTIVSTQAVEVAIKKYRKDDYEKSHFHKIATEITVIVEGKVKMNDKIFVSGDIITIEPYETTDFLALEKTITTVVKIPGAKDDKYISKND